MFDIDIQVTIGLEYRMQYIGDRYINFNQFSNSQMTRYIIFIVQQTSFGNENDLRR